MASSAINSSESDKRGERLMTLDEYEDANPLPGFRTELVVGSLLVRDSPKQRHGQVVVRVLTALIHYLDRHFATETESGLLLSNDVGILLRQDPPTVRAPDIAYYVAARAPVDTGRYSETLPDLVVEVRSPTDRAGYLRQKIDEWRRGGCNQIWVADPRERTIAVHGGEAITTLQVGEVFDGEPLFPGLDLDIATIFR